MNPNRKMLLMSLTFTILLTLVYTTQSEGISSKSTCEVSFSSLKGLPAQVLVGTDIADISSFKNSSSPLKNKYYAEMGGAILTMHVTQNKKGIMFKRTYMEPGIPGSVREYFPVCIKDEHLSADKLKGKLVKDGLIILEEKPDVGGIPDNLWIFYQSN